MTLQHVQLLSHSYLHIVLLQLRLFTVLYFNMTLARFDHIIKPFYSMSFFTQSLMFIVGGV